MSEALPFDPDCRACPRLATFLSEVRATRPDYHTAPVPGFGVTEARLLVVGLAPGMHGANRTGRPFTGDHAGLLLYDTLYQFGFSNQPHGDDPDDGLELYDARIVNAVRCLPPENKPKGEEIRRCNSYLKHDLNCLPERGVVLALGQVAHQAIVRALGLRQKDYLFGHGHEFCLSDGRLLLDTYHCSRYNTQTRRLTPEMFQGIFARARAHLESVEPS